MNTITRASLGFFLLAVFVGQLRGDFVVNPISATSSIADNFGTSLVNTINGVGLSAFPSLTATHEGTIPDNSWVGAGTSGNIDFDLGGLFQIDGFSFWNQNGGGPGINGSTGINDVNVFSSTDGVNYNLIAGGPSAFSLVPGFGPELPEVFLFGPVSATHIRFDVISSHGDTSVGFAEVAFHAVVVPEPSTLIFCTSGIAVLSTVRRRR